MSVLSKFFDRIFKRSLQVPSGFIRAGETPVYCAPDEATVCESAWCEALSICQRFEGKVHRGGKVIVKWHDSDNMPNTQTGVGRAEQKRGGWVVYLGQWARENLRGYLVHEFVHCIRVVPGHDPIYDRDVFAWRYSREATGK